MLTGDTSILRKARGAFFTPAPVAGFLVDWAVRDASDAVLEPSCGEAVFLHAAARHVGKDGRLVGVELHAASAQRAARTLAADGVDARIHTGDFFAHNEFGRYNAVVGNPPYVRYQDFSGADRANAQRAALRGGVRLTNLASSWAAFTVHAALHLRTGGRLALVLPAELLTVNYAGAVRRFLMDRFSHVELVLFTERVIPEVQEEVVLLLADGYAPDVGTGTDHMIVRSLHNAGDLSGLVAAGPARRWMPTDKSAKWSAGLLSADGLAAYTGALGDSGFTGLQTWGETTLGMVTGNNRFFTLSPAKAAELGLAPTDTIALSPPGSRHLRSMNLTAAQLSSLGGAGQATLLFRPATTPSRAARQYIRSGEDLDVHQAYKCRVRRPWWRVPYLKPADLLLTYMNADTPRLASNQARAHHLNSVHGVYLHSELRADGMSLLPLASLNSLTLLGAELVGRPYGGGMLKIEPREADQLPVPAPALVRAHAAELRAIRPAVRRRLREGNLLGAAELVDDILLTGAMSMPAARLDSLRADHAHLSARRRARGRTTAGRAGG
ncbi:class I SAM-dependent DNA methyltransferase [Gordonia sp. (in: high G+C Gram-positive bacteria)]|jgi:hypothetical protein|uniref:HsdM family class I SAM-dependent methyltransferase n=1 Tax=Gordonia sp. (in: high G+C Gram-positive bacteria) TaxID=84139 RepID=UPI001DC64083|nr:N-6 DNA methylase [Gordonia sp. (in: high G+C Gram-positive bacteria)]MCB1294406.1 N-6 DNA methylase [Gordonia sp. (in: high G+C Gram-positive bacteria)]HMS76630.1 N-6 DNA methylase [Gordonia sp. (in: high G+C Gram-positive bacteria)]